MSNLDEARSALVGAAMEITPGTWTDVHLVKRLCEAATAYADARRASATPKAAGVADHRSDELTLPFGRSKGKTLGEAAKADLEWMLPRIRESVDDASKGRWRDSNMALADAIEAELERR